MTKTGESCSILVPSICPETTEPIHLLAYFLSNITALVIEGQLTKSFRRRKMEKLARQSKEHYIVCGLGRVASYIINELNETRRPYVAVDINHDTLEKASETVLVQSFPDKSMVPKCYNSPRF